MEARANATKYPHHAGIGETWPNEVTWQGIKNKETQVKEENVYKSNSWEWGEDHIDQLHYLWTPGEANKIFRESSRHAMCFLVATLSILTGASATSPRTADIFLL